MFPTYHLPGSALKEEGNMGKRKADRELNSQTAVQKSGSIRIFKPGTKTVIASGHPDDLIDMTRPDGEPALVPMWRVKDMMYDRGFVIGLPDKVAKTKAIMRAEEKEKVYAQIHAEEEQAERLRLREEIRAEVLEEIEGKTSAKKGVKK